jgi:hypothetical protein
MDTSDHIDTLAVDKTAKPDEQDNDYLNLIFQEDKTNTVTLFVVKAGNFLILSVILFILFSLPQITNGIGNILPMAKNQAINIIIKTILFSAIFLILSYKFFI